MTYLLWVVGIIAGAFLGLVFTILMQDRISILIARALGGLYIYDSSRSISGDWYTYYVVLADRTTSVSAKIPSKSIEIIRLRRVGSRVTGVNVRESRDYIILGTLRDGSYFTGTWRDVSRDRYHWGGFQLWWLDSGQGMVGKFVGKDSRNHVNHGIWLWCRSEEGLYNLADWAASRGGYRVDAAYLKAGLDAARQSTHHHAQ